jgi:hypothetical protein
MKGSVIGQKISAADAYAPCLMWTRQSVAELFDHAITGKCSASVLPAM